MAARYTARLSGVDVLAVMLLDVLSALPELKICTAYDLDGQRITRFSQPRRRPAPRGARLRDACPAGRQEITDVRRLGDLPTNARKYLDRLGRVAGPAGGSRFPSAPIASRRFLRKERVSYRKAGRRKREGGFCPGYSLPTAMPEPMYIDRTSDVPRRATAAAHRHHHGRQRALGPATGPAADRRTSPAGATSVRRVTEECARLGIGQVTLYCLSSENWKRPAEELDFLLHLLQQYLVEERPTIMEHNIRVTWIGRREGLPGGACGNSTRPSA